MTRNLRGEILTIKDEEDRTVTINRDIMGRVIKETSPGGREVSYEWGGAGCDCGDDVKLTQITDSGNKIWKFNYDESGNPIEMVYPDGTKILQEFNVAGMLSKFSNRRGQDITYDYDTLGRLLTKTSPEGNTNFTYDEMSRIDEIVNADFSYKYNYGLNSDAYGKHTLTEEKNTLNNLWSQYLTNQNGLPHKYFDNTGIAKDYRYTFSGTAGTEIGFLPTQVFYGKNGYGTYYAIDNTYTKFGGLLKSTSNKLRREEFYRYNTNDMVRKIEYSKLDGWTGDYPSVYLNLNRDNSEMITSVTSDYGNLDYTAQFSDDLEVTDVNHTLPSNFSEGYTYDIRGNRLSSLMNNFVYNDHNQLVSSDSHSYNYDADGNLTVEKNISTTETKKYYYSSENRMIRYEHYATEVAPVDIIAEYKYDIYGRRLSKTVNGAVTNFLWEGDNLAYEMDDTYQPIRRYFNGGGKDNMQSYVEFSEAADDLFQESNNSGWYSYIRDQVGTIFKTVRHTDYATVENKSFDVFGNVVSQTGNSSGNLGFQSKYFDTETGMNYYYHRYYKPEIGRFLNEDPIGISGGMNLFRFTENNPVNFFDLYGLLNEKVRIYSGRMYIGDGRWIPLYREGVMNNSNGNVDWGPLIPGFMYDEPCMDQDCFWDCMKDELIFSAVAGKVGEKIGKKFFKKLVKMLTPFIPYYNVTDLGLSIMECLAECKN